MAGRSRWFVGSSSTSQFAPEAISSARLARVRSPGERLCAGRADRVVLQAELGQQRAGLLLRQLALRDERVEQRGGAVEAEARLVEHADPHAGADPARARASGSRPRSPSTSVVFPLPFGPTSATRSPHASSRSSGPSTKLPRRSSARSRRTVTSPERSPPPKRSCSSQRRHGLSTVSSRSIAFSVARTFAACFSERSVRCAADRLVGLVVGRGLGLAHAGLRPLALAAGAVGEAVALGDVASRSGSSAWRAAVARSSR